VNLQCHEHLDQRRQKAVLAIVQAATEADGINPISEHVALHLRAGGDKADTHFTLSNNDGEIIGYAHLDETDKVAGPSAEIVVHPKARRQGVGRILTQELLKVAGSSLRLWSHGELAESESLASALGFIRVREVIQMRRSLELPSQKFELASSTTIDRFDPEQDTEEWLTLNRRVFADHPEQSNWTAYDLALRMNEPWFEPNGFFLARRNGQCIGFCWTKVHGETGHEHTHPKDQDHGHDPIGEIYVIGVDPDFQGQGLGRLLTLVGMDYLKRLGLRTVMLYVEGDNIQAQKLYEDLGFTSWGKDVMYRQRIVQSPDTPN